MRRAFAPVAATAGAAESYDELELPHDVTAADGRFHATLQPNEQWQFPPTTPGRIEYVCTLHPGMKGVFVVQ